MGLIERNETSRQMHRVAGLRLPKAVSASGSYIRLEDGSEILDASCGPAVTCLGHSHPRLVSALAEQAGTLDYAHGSLFLNEPAEQLADLLVEGSQGAFTRVIYNSSGSEAVETAFKVARQYHYERGDKSRTHIISRRQSYHGATLAALEGGGHLGRRAIYEDTFYGAFSKVSPCFAYRGKSEGESDEGYSQRLAAELEEEILRIGPRRVSAFCIETIVGAAAGCVTATSGYLPLVKEVCERYGVLLILDEVMCGLGRSGTMHAWEQEGIQPDIQAVAKGLAGGIMPLGAVLLSGKVADAIIEGSRVLQHGQTFQAHPIACRAAIEVQHIIRDEELLHNVRKRGQDLEAGLRSAFGQHPNVGDIRGRGLFWAIELVRDRGNKSPFPPEARLYERMYVEGFSRGIAIYPGSGTADGREGDHAIIAPPFNVSEGEMGEILARMEEAVTAALHGLSQ